MYFIRKRIDPKSELPAKLTSRFLLPISSRQIDESIVDCRFLPAKLLRNKDPPSLISSLGNACWKGRRATVPGQWWGFMFDRYGCINFIVRRLLFKLIRHQTNGGIVWCTCPFSLTPVTHVQPLTMLPRHLI